MREVLDYFSFAIMKMEIPENGNPRVTQKINKGRLQHEALKRKTKILTMLSALDTTFNTAP